MLSWKMDMLLIMELNDDFFMVNSSRIESLFFTPKNPDEVCIVLVSSAENLITIDLEQGTNRVQIEHLIGRKFHSLTRSKKEVLQEI